MPVAKVRIEYEAPSALFSPFSGRPAEGDRGPNTRDKTLLFIYYGDAGEYGHIGKRAVEILTQAGVKNIESLSPGALARRLNLPSTLLLEVDAGWNGVNYYAFAPLGVNGAA